jgi:hypothetical protein
MGSVLVWFFYKTMVVCRREFVLPLKPSSGGIRHVFVMCVRKRECSHIYMLGRRCIVARIVSSVRRLA